MASTAAHGGEIEALQLLRANRMALKSLTTAAPAAHVIDMHAPGSATGLTREKAEAQEAQNWPIGI